MATGAPMVSEATEQTFRLRTKQTAEGLAFYPNGAWGAGYLLDARTEAGVKRFLDRQIWIVMGCIVPIGQLPLPTVVKILLFGAAAGTAIPLGLRFVLRHSTPAKARLTSDELRQRQAAGLDFPRVYRTIVISAAMLAYCIGGAFLSSSIVERWIWALVALALVAGVAVHLYRLYRARRRLVDGQTSL